MVSRPTLLLVGFDPGGVSRGPCDVVSVSSIWALSLGMIVGLKQLKSLEAMDFFRTYF